jgi:hypothetical protein
MPIFLVFFLCVSAPLREILFLNETEKVPYPTEEPIATSASSRVAHTG